MSRLLKRLIRAKRRNACASLARTWERRSRDGDIGAREPWKRYASSLNRLMCHDYLPENTDVTLLRITDIQQ